MFPRRSFLPGGLICLAALLAGPVCPARATDPPDGVEVLARGPVHEAYAEPVEALPTPGPVIAKEPPAPIEEMPPEEKPEGDNVQWVPGYWSWDEERVDFLWVSGFWRVPPPNRVWVPGSWRKAPAGWQWAGGFWAPAQQQAEVQYLPPPPAALEVGPTVPAPSATHVYVPGCWVYRDRYVWRPGYWVAYRPGWMWIPAHYRWTPAGYVFVSGYWDYPLADRGVLFAPVYIQPTVYVRPAYVYTPTIVVREQCMYSALFVRRGHGCYYFGDYFAPRYTTVGFTAWCAGGNVAFGVEFGRRSYYDPLFSYYRVAYRDDPFWRGGITEVYVGRYRGTIAPPPRTFVQQTTVINNITNVNVTNVNVTNVNNRTTVNNVTMLAPLKSVRQTNTALGTSSNLKLQPVAADARREQAQAARQLQEVAKQRTHLETQLAAKGPARPTDAPRSVKLDVPKTALARAALPEGGPTHKPVPPPLDHHASNPHPASPPRPNPLPPSGKLDAKPATPAPTHPGSGPRPNPPSPVGHPAPKPDAPRANPPAHPAAPNPYLQKLDAKPPTPPAKLNPPAPAAHPPSTPIPQHNAAPASPGGPASPAVRPANPAPAARPGLNPAPASAPGAPLRPGTLPPPAPPLGAARFTPPAAAQPAGPNGVNPAAFNAQRPAAPGTPAPRPNGGPAALVPGQRPAPGHAGPGTPAPRPGVPPAPNRPRPAPKPDKKQPPEHPHG